MERELLNYYEVNMLKVGEKILSRQDIYRYFGSLQQIAGLKRFTCSEGKAKGLEAVECRSGNGEMVLPSRGYCVSTIGLDENKIRRYVK